MSDPNEPQSPDPQFPEPPQAPQPPVPPAGPVPPETPGFAAPTPPPGFAQQSFPPPVPPAYGQPVQPGEGLPGYPGYPGGVAAPGYAPYPVAPRWNVLAIIAFIAAFVIPLAAIICGHIALSQIKRTGEQGRALGLWGTVLGYVFTFGGIAIAIVIFLSLLAVCGSSATACTS